MIHGKDKDWGQPKPDRDKGEEVYSDGTSWGDSPAQESMREPLDMSYSEDVAKPEATVAHYQADGRIQHIFLNGKRQDLTWDEFQKLQSRLYLFRDKGWVHYYRFRD